ncbi:hypothetical protein [uncultured Nostoc sp.]|uniref:hypothetical protein n=1 Tax=uncultured Nostoc sp. TaxID=340711 RepID=UPI0026094E35|nr:hypothetical protein [uncultured Nostoc sp.]
MASLRASLAYGTLARTSVIARCRHRSKIPLKPMVNTPNSRWLKPLFLRWFLKVCGLLNLKFISDRKITLYLYIDIVTKF